jgi:formylglycine-generating enzyme required for sulfatase activity
MLIQSERTLPPLGVVRPDFQAMSREAATKAVPNKLIDIPARKITLGLNDDDKDTKTKRYFGWDNEKPQRYIDVHAFVVQARPITNGEYAKYLEAIGSNKLPASWFDSKPIPNRLSGHTNGLADELTNGNSKDTTKGISNYNSFVDGKTVRTVFGSVPLRLALDWPIMASYDELADFASWSGGRIPTLEEVKSIYEYADELKGKEVVNALGKTIPAVNRYVKPLVLEYLTDRKQPSYQRWCRGDATVQTLSQRCLRHSFWSLPIRVLRQP